MKQHVGLVVLEHLGDQLNVHILNVDVLFRQVSGESITDGAQDDTNGFDIPVELYS